MSVFANKYTLQDFILFFDIYSQFTFDPENFNGNLNRLREYSSILNKADFDKIFSQLLPGSNEECIKLRKEEHEKYIHSRRDEIFEKHGDKFGEDYDEEDEPTLNINNFVIELFETWAKFFLEKTNFTPLEKFIVLFDCLNKCDQKYCYEKSVLFHSIFSSGTFYESIFQKCINKMKKNKDAISECLTMVIGNEDLWKSYRGEMMEKYNIQSRVKLAFFLSKYVNIKKILPVNLRDVPSKQDDYFFIDFKKEFLELNGGILP